MDRAEVRELHYITPLENVPSILDRGILSHARAARIEHESVALEEVQSRRKVKQIPGARPLHEYANLYFDAHNPMLCRRQDENDRICVLRVSADVLDLPGVIVADMNASSDYVTFRPVASGLKLLDSSRVFARYWTHRDNPIDEFRHKSEKCAEVLVPDLVAPDFIIAAYVANQRALSGWQRLKVHVEAEIRHGFFF
ncbi:MAG: hypothetical protein AMXMBFR82_22050 [Candidatus Hydrogenedentota bacterium]